jgi:membrane protease subunit (stomatin/prohibitin family)
MHVLRRVLVMGLFNFLKKQLIEVIEWLDNTSNSIVYRFPAGDNEIKMGAQLIVRESQVAVFVNEGQIADIYPPGRYELYTQNMPVLTKLKSWKYGFNSPFKAEVYFVNTKQFTDQKWGTSNPIMMRDPEFGMLRLRAYGIFSFQVSDAEKFLKEIFGTKRYVDTDEIAGYLKRSLVSGIADTIAEEKIPALDLAMHYDELSEKAKTKLQAKFESLGLKLNSLVIENISLPEEVEKALDKRTSMGVLGNMQQYIQYRAAEAMGDAAKNPGSGLASAGIGLGAGAALGQALSNALNNPVQPTPQPKAFKAVTCPHCMAQVPEGSKFCGNCGKPVAPPKDKCIKCGHELDKGVKFCPECGTQQIKTIECGKCGKQVNAGVKFCPECGNKLN